MGLDKVIIGITVRVSKSTWRFNKAIDVIDAAGAKAKLSDAPSVNVHMIQEQVSKISKVPLEPLM